VGVNAPIPAAIPESTRLKKSSDTQREGAQRSFANRDFSSLEETGPLGEREHSSDQVECGLADGLGNADVWAEVTQAEIKLLECVEPHAGALVARATLVHAGRLNQIFVRRALVDLVKDAVFCRDDQRASGANSRLNRIPSDQTSPKTRLELLIR